MRIPNLNNRLHTHTHTHTYIYIYVYVYDGGGSMVGFEPQIGDTIKNVAKLSLEPPKINLRG